jgi:hypothetical protein
MMSATRSPSFAVPRDILAIVRAARVAEVEFCEWCVAPTPNESTLSGHIQVGDRRAVSRVIEALLDLDASVDVDVGPSTTDARGKWSVWVRARRVLQTAGRRA